MDGQWAARVFADKGERPEWTAAIEPIIITSSRPGHPYIICRVGIVWLLRHPFTVEIMGSNPIRDTRQEAVVRIPRSQGW